ncbi:MAG: hypothetical protein AAFY46_12660, partial [Planctomycetota bacterium]
MTDGILIHTVGDGEGIGYGPDGIFRAACEPPCCDQASAYYRAVNCFDAADAIYIPVASTCSGSGVLPGSVVRFAGSCYDVDDTPVVAADLPDGATVVSEQAFPCFDTC